MLLFFILAVNFDLLQVVDSSSYTDSSSQVADVGSTSPWEGYQDTPPPKK